MKTKLEELYPMALHAITPHAITGETLVGSNQALALCCCTLVLARKIEVLIEILDDISTRI